jgi:hypothetical protein
LPPDGIPTGKASPSRYPCRDYAEWISLVRDTIRAVKPDADVVFWTYNWGWADEDVRLELLDRLPTDISLLVTFEMFQKFDMGDCFGNVSDYSIYLPGPGEYFISEAQKAKEQAGAFLDEIVMHEVLSEVKDIAQRGGISCACGSLKWGLKVNYSSIDLSCTVCGAEMRIPAATADDIDDICCKNNILIRGRKR